MNEKTAWYLGYREKTAVSRWGKWLEETRPFLRQLQGPATEWGDTPADDLLMALTRGKHYRGGQSGLATDFLQGAASPRSGYESLADAKRTLRQHAFQSPRPFDPMDEGAGYFTVGNFDPLTMPLGHFPGRSRIFTRSDTRSPLRQLSRAEKRIGKPALPDVEAPPFIPLRYPS